MAIIKTTLCLLAVILIVLWILSSFVGVWLPDIVFAPRQTIASTNLANGYKFRVIQYWNRSDFYSTVLHVTSPDGQRDVHTLDGDDSKSWRVPLTVNEQSRTVKVILSGKRARTVEY